MYPTEPRRAAVAIIIRVVPPPNTIPVAADTPLPTLNQFFELDWVKDPLACPEFLLLRRDGAGPSDAVPGRASAFQNFTGDGTWKSSGKAGAHVAFPGGRTEEGDEGGLYTGICVLSIFLTLSHSRPHGSHASNMGGDWLGPCRA